MRLQISRSSCFHLDIETLAVSSACTLSRISGFGLLDYESKSLRLCSYTVQKYDVLSCGMGALACTSFFVYNGQDTGTALSITLMATISGLVSIAPRVPFRRLHCADAYKSPIC